MQTGSRFTLLQWLLLLLCLSLASGCATKQEEVLPEQKYYEQAREALKGSNFNAAQRNLEALETYYPFGRYAEQAQLDLIYARYRSQDLDGARSSADRFLRLNPQSDNADYALYVRGVASYYMDLGLAVRYFPVSAAGRDPGEQISAFRDFYTLITQYPDSEYAPDARQRMIAIRNRLAAGEIHAARYYIKREAYIAALRRAQYVVENFPSTPAVEDALVIMTEMFSRLGLRQEANEGRRMLALNYPDNPALDSNGRFIRQNFGIQDRSLRNVLTFGLLGKREKPRD
ncbi:MAG: outer membrane protein assembly factor BamD [Oleiphilaceae bacterium]|nr:outer membrane protein assembly factor BamD [Oleiphilaceae bacterium]